MSLGPFGVGEQPADPLVLTVVDAAGAAVDFDDYDTVALEGDIPAGTATPLAGGVLQYKMSAPFTTAGTYVLRVTMEQADGDIDYSQPFEFTVVDDLSTTLLSPDDVYTSTGSSVTMADIVSSQAIVSLVVGADLTDADWLASLSAKDLFWLKRAVAWQAVDEASDLDIAYVPGATSVKAGDVSVTYSSAGTSTGEAITSRYAQMALKRLSWLSPFRSIQAKPFSRRFTPEEAAMAVIEGF